MPITSSTTRRGARVRMSGRVAGGLVVAALVLTGCAQNETADPATVEATDPPTGTDKARQLVSVELEAKLGAADKVNYDLLLVMAEGPDVAALYRAYEGQEAQEYLNFYKLDGDRLTPGARYRSTQKVGTGPLTTTYFGTGASDPANRDFVLSMYRDVIDLRRPDAPARYIREDYIQHNPAVPQGRAGIEGFVKAMGPAPEGAAPTRTESLVIADGELVLMVSELGGGRRIVDLFRIQEGLIAEHWDFTPLA